jgi:hypothetical protein
MKRFLEVIMDPIKATIYRNSLRHATSSLEFKVTQLGDVVSALGAITMIFDELLMTSYFDKLFHFDNIKYNDSSLTQLLPLI